MPSTRDIRRRIKSVKNTAQITKAMQMVAASKMRKAQQAALAGRPLRRLDEQGAGRARRRVAGISPIPFSKSAKATRRCVILVSTDKGLCGGLNSNLMREAAKFDPGHDIHLRRPQGFAIPRPDQADAGGRIHLQGRPARSARPAPSPNSPRTFTSRAKWTRSIFCSPISFPPWCKSPKSANCCPSAKSSTVTAGIGAKAGAPSPPESRRGEFLFEPNQEQVLGALLPHSLNFQVYQILLEAKASEHSARMVAMKNATDNAKQFIKDLTLEYNKLRQANITKELLEITSAAMAIS